jgi:endonuclease/exonuclease/phosphatase family metal-dependent hydrolase
MRPTVRVATINIWNRMGPWDERLAALRAELARIDADIVAVQEVLQMPEYGFDQGAALAEGLGYHVAFGRHPDAPESRIGNAILSRFPFEAVGVHALPGADELRCAVFGAVASPQGTIPVFSTHLNWRLDHGHIRQEQVKSLIAYVEACAPAAKDGIPPIVMGDFNAEPDADEIRYLRGLTPLGGRSVYFSDCFAVAGDGSAGYTFARSNEFAAMLREPNRRIDYVFVRGPDERFRGEPLDAAVAFTAKVAGVLPSDHYGVVATVGL